MWTIENMTIPFTYAWLFLSVICLWVPYKGRFPLWFYFLVLALGYGATEGLLDWQAFFSVGVMSGSLYIWKQKELAHIYRVPFLGIALLMALALGMHKVPYFHNFLVFSQVYISRDGVPFTMYLNIDKALVGLLLLGMLQPLIRSRRSWQLLFEKMLPLSIGFGVALLLLATAAGKIHFDPKIPVGWKLWLINNLLFVCVAEEAFFRGLLQRYGAVLLEKYSWGEKAAWFAASLLFGFAHYAGGIAYSLWGTLAGLFYGWVYRQHKQIEASILAHFCVNTLHFLLFTYPVLAS